MKSNYFVTQTYAAYDGIIDKSEPIKDVYWCGTQGQFDLCPSYVEIEVEGLKSFKKCCKSFCRQNGVCLAASKVPGDK